MRLLKVLLLVGICLALLVACDIYQYDNVGQLPRDSGGSLSMVAATSSNYGYWVYLPGGYASSTASYPLLVYLHGDGAFANQTPLTSLNWFAVNAEINNKRWNPSLPMVVISPQGFDGGPGWVPAVLHGFTQRMMATYRINPKRVYLTGTSRGGGGTYSYLYNYGNQSLFAAAVPVCGYGSTYAATKYTTPIWAFHGQDDTTVSCVADVSLIQAIKKANPWLEAKITVLPGYGHDITNAVYDGEAMGKESRSNAPYYMSFADWLLLHHN